MSHLPLSDCRNPACFTALDLQDLTVCIDPYTLGRRIIYQISVYRKLKRFRRLHVIHNLNIGGIPANSGSSDHAFR